ncbi:L,D-transpeptidase family protein [Persicobacter diffluens]|uniref:Peptidoglycan-binding protein n=1 Tax=Persicobacter diffluens TaxID=981 RepID=A0AAN4W1G9_9BACT|nr:peptidoglycan-binding protein [Persicobacter diffluens]
MKKWLPYLAGLSAIFFLFAFYKYFTKREEIKTYSSLAHPIAQKIPVITPQISGEIKAIIRQEESLPESDTVIANFFVPQIYASRDFAPYWGSAKNRKDMLSYIENMDKHGLSPEFYHLAVLKKLNNIPEATKTELQKAQEDVLLTDGLVTIIFHFLYGALNPKDIFPDWNYGMVALPENIVQTMYLALLKEQIPEQLNSIAFRMPFYEALYHSLEKHRQIQAQGGFIKLPAIDKAIHPGNRHDLIPSIRTRIAQIQEIEKNTTDSTLYDDHLKAAIITYQNRHGLNADGIIGKGTINTLNVACKDRMNTLLVNLERSRWLSRESPKRHVTVNIAGYQLYLIDNRKVTFATRVMVGKKYHKTPVFTDTLKYIVLNPYWNVPKSIAVKEMLPKLKVDPDYLDRNNMSLVETDGTVLNPHSIPFEEINENNFHFMVKQKPGPKNALGQVKFLFPNQYSVYLHDTPSRYLFNTENRAYSHGCVRVEHPLKLASLLLRNTQWDQKAIDEQIASKENKHIRMQETVPINIVYLTAQPGKNGQLHFYKDVYQRDQKILKMLKEIKYDVSENRRPQNVAHYFMEEETENAIGHIEKKKDI